ncbi:MAG: T9SS type A sorting domain-containing protein, partial [Saprospiraceae bacterium]|nr:T9SS type A sorting domain-containing protein [Saprospiraceae bacterium]
KGNFYGSTNTFELGLDGLQNSVWYDVAYVVESDSISLYLNGYLEKTIAVDQNLRGNEESMYLGTQAIDGERSLFYNGRMDNFKYWKQKLSGQDVLYLHFPEKEFEVKQQYFLSCCEEASFNDIVIDKNNPLDSFVVANASPTGYDSVYILSFIQNDAPPQLNNDLIPDDVIVSYQQQCEEFCSATAVWEDPSSEVFSDNCEILDISQSHTSPLVLDENVSFVEVVYTATDICGQSNSFSVGLELECLPSTVEAIPENNTFTLQANQLCIDPQENTICKFSDISLVPGFINDQTGSMESYSENADYDITVLINGVEKELNTKDNPLGLALPELKEEGSYEVCLQTITNECNAVSTNYCQTINIKGSSTLDHGTVVACPDNFEEVLPTAISGELKNLILSNPQETTVSISNEDDCGCVETETIKIELATPNVLNEVVIEACPEMFPLNILGLEINEDDDYNQTVVRFENASLVQNSIGNHCDSLVSLTVIQKEAFFENVMVEICEGENYYEHETSGTYTRTLDASNGCDSTIVLDLVVHPKSFSELFVEICPDSTYLGYSEEGIYELIGTNAQGCDSLTTLNLTVLDESDPLCMTSSISQEFLNQFSISPNPVNSVLTVEGKNTDFKDIKVSILDISGKLINAPVENKKIINVSHLNQGIYLLRIEKEGKEIGVKRFLKM